MSNLKPINIIFGSNKDNIDFSQFIFEITLLLNDDSTKKHNEISYSKHCKLFTSNDMIPYNMIKSYILNITVIKFTKESYKIEKIFDNTYDTYIYKNDDMYIEFSKNTDGYTTCCCSLRILDNSRVFVTPPNY